jgi:hypothetical protein
VDGISIATRRYPRRHLPRATVLPFWSRTERYDEANRIAAQLILEDPERFGDKNAGLVRWARMTKARITDQERVPVPDVRQVANG